MQQQPTINPFSQMMTGQPGPFGQAPPQLAVQPTGFLIPQQTAVPMASGSNPFNNMLGAQQPQGMLQPQATGHRPFSAFIPTQQTGLASQGLQAQQTGIFQQQQTPQLNVQSSPFQQPQQTGLQPQTQPSFLRPNFLQAQATGANPFRASMMAPQTTGAALFSAPAPAANGATLGQSLFTQQPTTVSAPNSASPFSTSGSLSTFSPQPSTSASAFSTSFGAQATGPPPSGLPNRPQSTPLTNNAPQIQAVKTHPTGTRNPFGPVITPPPPVPKVPTLMELAMGMHQPNGTQEQNQPAQAQTTPATQSPTATSGFNFTNSALNPGPTDISSIASSFTGVGSASQKNAASSTNQTSPPNQLEPQHTAVPSMFGQQAGTQLPGTSLKPQTTGFAGLKPFKPSSSFGAALMESLPSIPSSQTQINNQTPSSIQPQNTATPSSVGAQGSSTMASPLTGALNAQPNGSTSTPFTSALTTQQTGGTGSLGSSFSGLNVQQTGTTPSFGTGNFTSTLSSQQTGPAGPFGASTSTPSATGTSSTPSTLGVGLRPQLTGGGGANPFRASMAAGGGAFGGSSIPPVPSLPPMFGGQPFGSAFEGQSVVGGQSQPQPQQQQQQQAQQQPLF